MGYRESLDGAYRKALTGVEVEAVTLGFMVRTLARWHNEEIDLGQFRARMEDCVTRHSLRDAELGTLPYHRNWIAKGVDAADE
jgi:hypothetical protein